MGHQFLAFILQLAQVLDQNIVENGRQNGNSQRRIMLEDQQRLKDLIGPCIATDNHLELRFFPKSKTLYLEPNGRFSQDPGLEHCHVLSDGVRT